MRDLTDKAVDYAVIIAEMTRRPRDFDAEAWDELTAMVDVDNFVRVGRFKEVMDWRQALELMDQYVRIADFHVKPIRVKQAGDIVFLELDERSTMHGQTMEMVTMTVFEFDAAGKIRRLDFYQ